MKKIMFNDKFGLTQAVIEGRKTMTRRIIHYKDILRFGHNKHSDKSDVLINLVAAYKIGETVAIAQAYKDIIARISPRFSPHAYDWMREEKGWTNKMFVKADLMPHRIRITGIKVERLQDITEEDCLKEGIEKDMYGNKFVHPDARHAFAAMIDRISGIGTWESNPWVFAYSFELVD